MQKQKFIIRKNKIMETLNLIGKIIVLTFIIGLAFIGILIESDGFKKFPVACTIFYIFLIGIILMSL